MTPNAALSYRIMTQSDYQRMPWKNGLGDTLEIQKYQDVLGLRFRISQAAVKEDGVFSNFSGLHRTLVLLSGLGMTLSHRNLQGDLAQHNLNSLLDIARFAGGDETNATLSNGSIEDLNIMVRESDTKAKVSAYFAPQQFQGNNNNDSLLTAFYANQPCKISVEDMETLALEANSCLIIKQNTALCLIEGSGVFINITDKSTTLT